MLHTVMGYVILYRNIFIGWALEEYVFLVFYLIFCIRVHALQKKTGMLSNSVTFLVKLKMGL